MLTDWLTAGKINVTDSVTDWQAAVRLSAEPLLAEGAITPAYVDAIIASHLEMGPYYVLAPGLAMPHARPEQGAKKNGLSLLHVRNGVSFESNENDPVKVIIMLCALSGDEHIAMITELAELFSDEQRLQQLLDASTLPAIQAVIEQQ
ncbi:PTS mannitol transporter subunit IIA [Enterobacterales bacterium CwR94]|nr:PTS mannitol transporter subunit IIA [Enterobacterales bacterium CwR94]